MLYCAVLCCGNYMWCCGQRFLELKLLTSARPWEQTGRMQIRFKERRGRGEGRVAVDRCG
ncbi:hypothetical protein E2C01_013117 [Portunus trituberculatus]|uniref:Uncharacterized protein n=1 Tax=Portunus trituberculatus TaxID=210409 RepID=A0A5B7DGH6_PORTR|nr:hypothetical protein [Portunus trituberculatus]